MHWGDFKKQWTCFNTDVNTRWKWDHKETEKMLRMTLRFPDQCYLRDSTAILSQVSITGFWKGLQGDACLGLRNPLKRRMAGSYILTVGSSSPSSVKNQSYCRREYQTKFSRIQTSIYREERKMVLLAEWESQRSCTDQACAWPCESCCLQRFWQGLGQTRWPSYVAPSN